MARTCSRIKVSASPKPASGPVRGLTWPILITLAWALAELALNSAGAAIAAAPDLISTRRFKTFFMVASLSFLRPHPEEAAKQPSRRMGFDSQPIFRDAAFGR